jgi:sorbitol-6-phosphate 2-dehydrogenase
MVQIKEINNIKLGIRKAVFNATGKYMPVSFFAPKKNTAGFWAREDAYKILVERALKPDELVYANRQPVLLEKIDSEKNAKKIKSQINTGEKHLTAFLVKGLGLFVAPVMKAASEGILQNQVAIVTGAGSGLGRSLASGLVRSGAMVGFLDVDEKAATLASESILKEVPDAQTIVLKCNVTSENEVNKTYETILNKWGGLDILVNAAGIAPAGPLVEFDVEKWRFALEINLTGYLIMAKAAAKIMIKQGMGGNIINLSSKSGLQASRDNTAYNATKAGEIHMARGWALELGQYGIRVNSVCPGNVFEGSKIWNPEYIKICANKYGIKPEEVIPYYTNQTALKREIKGQDVADSIIFLCSDKARTITGQTIVVDSGQVMVR